MQATERAAVSTTSSQKGVVTPKRSPAHTSSHCPPSPPPALRFYACVRAKSLQSCPLSATLGTVALQAPLSVGFSRQDCCSGLPCPPPGGLPNPGTEPRLLCLLHRPRAPPGPPSVPRDLLILDASHQRDARPLVDFFLLHVHVFKVHPCWGGLSAPSVSEAEAYTPVCYPLLLGWALGRVPRFGRCESRFCECPCTVLCLERLSALLLDTWKSCAWRDSPLPCWTLGSA